MARTRLSSDSSNATVGSAADYRRKILQDADDRAAARDNELESQASPTKDPRERIGIWERLHALRLPEAPGHALVQVIARQTRLTVAQVREEQQRRAGGHATAATPL